jgi:hypothetical protein
MLVKKLNKVSTEQMDIEVTQQVTMLEHIKCVTDKCTELMQFDGMTEKTGVVETLTNAFSIATKFPFQFYILKKGLQQTARTVSSILNPIYQNVLTISDKATYEQSVILNSTYLFLPEIKLCHLMYKC